MNWFLANTSTNGGRKVDGLLVSAGSCLPKASGIELGQVCGCHCQRSITFSPCCTHSTIVARLQGEGDQQAELIICF